MKEILIILFVWLLLITSSCFAQDYPDGTVIFSRCNEKRAWIPDAFGGEGHYHHVVVILQGWVHESIWPFSKRTPVKNYFRDDWTYKVLTPKEAYSQQEANLMLIRARSLLGKPYNLRKYFHPNTKKTIGTYCSQYVRLVLNASRRYDFSWEDGYQPQNLYELIKEDYQE